MSRLEDYEAKNKQHNENVRKRLLDSGTILTSHKLATLLLSLPDLPVATNGNHIDLADRNSHGSLMVGLLKTYAGDHVVIGHMIDLIDNGSNWKIAEVWHKGGN